MNSLVPEAAQSSNIESAAMKYGNAHMNVGVI